MTISQALQSTLSQIPETDPTRTQVARGLVNFALGVSSEEFFQIPSQQELTASEVQKLQTYTAEYLAGKPLAYITGTTEFSGLILKISPAALIPRPETEELLELLLNEIKKEDQNSLSILEIGTGTGCIGATLVKRLPNQELSYTGLEISVPAFELTIENISQVTGISLSREGNTAIFTGKDLSIKIVNCDIANFSSQSQFDYIVSNPPYITDLEMLKLPPEVANFEPKIALAGGKEGLDIYNSILEFCKQQPQLPRLFLEASPSTLPKLKIIASRVGYEEVEVIADKFGRERFLVA